MSFQIFPVPPILKPMIRTIWGITGLMIGKNCVEDLLPDGCISMLFNLGTEQPDGTILGQKTEQFRLINGRGTGFIVVTINPAYGGMVLGCPAGELLKQNISCDQLFGVPGDRLCDHILGRDIFDGVKLITSFLIERVVRSSTGFDRRVAAAVNRIVVDGGRSDLVTLSDQLNLSKRHLERLFCYNVGLSPKKFTRMIRFQWLLHQKTLYPEQSLTTLALRGGYSDQSHMIRDFREITGLSPKNYFATTEAYSDLYGCPVI